MPALMAASAEQWQLVISFNEWGENTATESAERMVEPIGSRSVPRRARRPLDLDTRDNRAMSQSNVELALRAFRAFEQRDMGSIEELCTPDIEFDWSRRLLDPVVTRGYEGIRGFFEEVDGIFEEIAFEEEEVLDYGDQVLVVSTGRFRGRTSGIDVTASGAQIWTIRDCKLARFRFYQSKEDALEDLEAEGAQVSAGPSTPAT